MPSTMAIFEAILRHLDGRPPRNLQEFQETFLYVFAHRDEFPGLHWTDPFCSTSAAGRERCRLRGLWSYTTGRKFEVSAFYTDLCRPPTQEQALSVALTSLWDRPFVQQDFMPAAPGGGGGGAAAAAAGAA